MFSKYAGSIFWVTVDKTIGKIKQYRIERTPGGVPVEMGAF